MLHHKDLLANLFMGASATSSSTYCNQLIQKFVYCFFKVVLEGYRRCSVSHDLSECHHLYDLGSIKSSPSYKFNSVNFDSEKLSMETLWDHLKCGANPKFSFFSLFIIMNLIPDAFQGNIMFLKNQ